MKNKIIQGDCLEELKKLEENSIDSIVTDPPYHLVSIVKRFGKEGSAPAKQGKDGSFARLSGGFMGKTWDGLGEDGIGIANNPLMWAECLRVLKPGGYLLSFGGTRTYHRMAVAIEDAGFEVRDMIEWVYGSGFPKSLNIGKAVDKLQGNERIATGEIKHHAQKGVAVAEERGAIGGGAFGQAKDEEITKGTSPWEGWGTALKPAHEPICMARKPLAEKTVAENVLKYGTGGINIDGCRVGYSETNKPIPQLAQNKREIKTDNGMYGGNSFNESKTKSTIGGSLEGRFPANLILSADEDGQVSEEVRECFPDAGKGNGKGAYNYAGREYDNKYTSMFNGDKPQAPSNFNDSGNASRFFKSIIYQAKASKSERNKGCEELEDSIGGGMNGTENQTLLTGSGNIRNNITKNNHPTVKPIALMSYLIKMVTPKGGIVLDPFAGSGSTLVAAKDNGYGYVGIEMTAEYIPIIEARLEV